jgi:hypothetical protein
MRMAAHICGHTLIQDRKVCAVVEIDAPQEVLVRFTAATVLSCYQARDDLDELTNTQKRAGGQILEAYDALGRRLIPVQKLETPG